MAMSDLPRTTTVSPSHRPPGGGTPSGERP